MKSLVLPSSAGEMPRGWVAFCGGAFDVDEEGAARMWRARPLVLALSPAAEGERDRLAERLRRAGVPVEVRDDPSRLSACAAHARLAAAETCPKCKARRACAACLHGDDPPLCPVCSGRVRFRARFRNVRVGILLFVLALVAWNTWTSVRRVTSWKSPLLVTLYPVNASGAPAVTSWTKTLDAADFQEIADFLEREAKRHGVKTAPLVFVRVAKPVAELPPPPPEDPKPAAVMAWSLKLRLWDASVRRRHDLPRGTVRIWVVYHEPGAEETLEHSVGLAKVHLGVVHATAGEADAPWARLAITHELLHTARASDKYGDGGKPVFPDGWAEPERPLPQARCEVMAGSIPVTEDNWFPARSLAECAVGTKTAEEVGWLAAAARGAQ